jgi:hypothetical protein
MASHFPSVRIPPPEVHAEENKKTLRKGVILIFSGGLCHIIKFFDGVSFWLCIEENIRN